MILLTESPMAFSDRLTKRHLTVTYNEPSTYLHPPLETPIAFSFPIQNIQSLTTTPEVTTKATKENTSHRVKSLPYMKNCNIPNKDQLPPSCIVDTAQFYAPSTTISKDTLSFSLDSPYLEIRHYIRLIIYPATSNSNISYNSKNSKYDKKKNNNTIAPICIGLPIHLTQNVSVTETEEDALPSYSSITRGAEELPDYDTSILREEQETESDSWDRRQQPQRRFSTATTIRTSSSSATPHRHRAYPSDEVDLVDLYNSRNNQQQQQQQQQQTTSTSSDETVITVQQSTDPFILLYGDNTINTSNNNDNINDNNYNNNSRLKYHQQHVLIQERRLEDFSLV
ncbi:hypothetical protein BDC45DRAFT_500810 [Circinella umbellata]|nr:hypothetical protein BDC45DRAFT_500810 [Circinella umbellata]